MSNLVGYLHLEERTQDQSWIVVAVDKKGERIAFISVWEDVTSNPYLSTWEVEVSDGTPCGKRKLFLREKK